MARQFIQSRLPTPEAIAKIPGIRWLGPRVLDPSVWHLNRRSAAGAVFIGLLVACIHFPMHTLVSVLLAVFFRRNLPLAILTTWASNPLTLVPSLVLAYMIGSFALQTPMLDTSQLTGMLKDFGLWAIGQAPNPFTHTYGRAFLALIVGMLIEGVLIGTIGAIATRVLWRTSVVKEWRKRQIKRAAYAQARQAQVMDASRA